MVSHRPGRKGELVSQFELNRLKTQVRDIQQDEWRRTHAESTQDVRLTRLERAMLAIWLYALAAGIVWVVS